MSSSAVKNAPARAFRALAVLLNPGDPSRSTLPFLPRPLKFFLLLLLLINCRSFPLNWHVRVFRPVFYTRFRWWTLLGRSKETKERWLDSITPIGENPLDKTCVFKTWASPDESDFNWHLSNSSYAKAIDAARLKFALESYSTFFRDGGWIALGATHYHFIKEIPIFASYEIRLSVVSWDQKWMYILARFVSQPRAKRLTNAPHQFAKDEPLRPQPLSLPIPSLHTPSTDPTPSCTPGTSTPAYPASGTSTPPVFHAPELDGATLHCLALSQVCFKTGRITVPPALAIAGAGFGVPADLWPTIRARRARGEMPGLLRGGWREVPPAERWWDQGLAGVEKRRLRGLEVVSKLRYGLEGLRSL